MARLLIFNPEHDYALANGSFYYRPPKSITLLAEQLRFVCATWGDPGDLVLSPDNRFFQISREGISEADPGYNPRDIEEISPWGWNPLLKHRLLSLGFTASNMPNDEELRHIRRLSHRRISIAFNEALHSPLIPKEFFSEEEAIQFAKQHPGCYFKLPWSSGGRGVVDTSELNERQIRQWAHGALKKQNSIMAETPVDKKIVFASLWEINDGRPEYKGFSISLSDGRGKYKGNIVAPQRAMQQYLQDISGENIYAYLEKQSEFLRNEVAPFYYGSLGIDMMVDKNGLIFPCIELNLRKTMGHVALRYEQLPSVRKNHIKAICPLPLLSLDYLSEHI